MGELKYQMHCHTEPCSACGRITPYALVKNLKNNGYSGAVLTNHFYNGNTGINRSLPWKKFVSAYEKDFEECKRFASVYGIDILFGIEEHIGSGQEILCYGITPEILYNHPELKARDLKIWHEILAPYGVLIIQAHPYRYRSYVSEISVLPEAFIDGIEVFNYGNQPEENEKAKEFALNNPELILTSGADAHLPYVISHGGIITNSRISSSAELCAILKSRQYSLITE